MHPVLTDFEVLTFDCYGTLIDWETGIWDSLQPLVEASSQRRDRSEVLAAFGQIEARHEAAAPGVGYPEILRRVHRDLANQLGIRTSEALDDDFAGSVARWPAFADSAGALDRLAADYKLVILSNIDNTSFEHSAKRLDTHFDAVYTAEDIGSFKPDPANFDYLLDHIRDDFGLQPGKILHTAQSLFHDHAPAKSAGLATTWIDRQRLSEGGKWGATAVVDAPPKPDFRFFTMSEMADAVAALK